MDAKTKKTIIIVGASTAIGFIGDALMYSLAASNANGGKFKFELPKGKALAQVLVLGFVTGLIVDYTVNMIIESQKTISEKSLDKIAKEDLRKIETGAIPGRVASKIVWT